MYIGILVENKGPLVCKVSENIGILEGCSISPTAVCSLPSYNDDLLGSSSLSSRGAKTKKPRGRPKKFALSLPDPIFVPSTPSKSCGEAIETWNLAKSLGIKADDDGAVLSALRKSKRLLTMEARNPVLG
ncbi:unnamed protein product [Amaranthus hypochondriacus]